MGPSTPHPHEVGIDASRVALSPSPPTIQRGVLGLMYLATNAVPALGAAPAARTGSSAPVAHVLGRTGVRPRSIRGAIGDDG